MKTLLNLFSKFTFFSVTLILIMSITGACKKSNDNNNDTGTGPGSGGDATASFTIDGDVYKNQKITITGVKGVRENGATYSSKWKFTSAVVGDRSKETEDNKNRLAIYFDGKETGKQESGHAFTDQDGVQDHVNFQLDLTTPDGEQTTYGYDLNDEASTSTPGTISITNYGDVNGTVEGDFEGTLLNVINGQLVHITEGHFKMTRSVDVH